MNATGSLVVTVPAPKPPVISGIPSGTNHNTGLCAVGCFDVLLGYSTPSYVSFDTPRSATLAYSSAQARPMGLVYADVKDVSARPPQKFSLALQQPGGGAVTFTNGTTELFFTRADASTRRLAGQFDATGLASGVYVYTAVVKSYWTSGPDAGTVLQSTAPAQVLVVNEQASPFGAGWSLAGLQHLVFTTDSLSVAVTDGTGSMVVFHRGTKSLPFTAPAGEFSRFAVMTSGGVVTSYTRTYRDGTVYAFSPAGILQSVHDRFGSTMDYHYNTSGQLTAVVDPANDSLTFAYTSGKLTTITDPGGRVSRFTVDVGTGNLTTIKDPTGATTFAGTYDTHHRLLQRTDRAGSTWLYRYDFASKLASDSTPAIQTSDAGVVRLGTRYRSLEAALLIDTASHLGTFASPASAPFPDSLRAMVLTPVGDSTRYALDGFGAPTLIENPLLKQVTTLTRDANSLVTKTVSTARGAPVHIETNVWSGPRLMQHTDNTSGISVSYTYDTTYDLVTQVSGNAPPVRSFLEPNKRWVDSTRAGGIAGDTVWKYTHDAIGRIVVAKDPRGDSTITNYATTGFRNTSTVTGGNRVTTYQYDAYGRLSSTTIPGGAVLTTQYDSLNRVRQTTGPNGPVTTTEYDDSNFVVRVTDAKGQLYQYAYNEVGWPQGTMYPNSNDPFYARVDVRNYSRRGLLSSYMNRRSQTTQYTYDAQGRMLTRTLADGRVTAFAYDTAGLFTADSSRESIDTTRVNSTGLVHTEITVRGGHRYVVTTTADGQGRPVSLVIQDGTTAVDSVRYGYDANWRLDTLVTNGSRTAFHYNTDGVQDLAALPSHDTIRVQVTRAHQPYSVSYSRPSLNVLFGATYQLDTLNRIVERTSIGGDSSWNYAYNTHNRLTSYMRKAYISPEVCTPDPHVMDGQVCVPGPATIRTSESYSYDTLGNRLDGGATYIPGNRLTSFAGYTLSYDPDGNITHKSKTGFDQYFYWNSVGQLDSVKTNGAVVRFGYDGAGRRVRKSTTTQTLWYIYNGSQVVLEVDSATGNRLRVYHYYPGVDHPHTMVEGGHTYYYLTGMGNGSIVGVIDSTGVLKSRYGYTPFGTLEDSLETVTNPIRYAGREYDAETRLYYFRARYYDPQLARFVSEDPAGLDGGINQYAYVGNDPVNNTDPSGLVGHSGLGDEDDTCHPYIDGVCGMFKSGPNTLGFAGSGCAGWGCGDIIDAYTDMLSRGADLSGYSLDEMPALSAACNGFGRYCPQLLKAISELEKTPASYCQALGVHAKSDLVGGFLTYGGTFAPPPYTAASALTFFPDSIKLYRGAFQPQTVRYVDGSIHHYTAAQWTYLTVAHEEVHFAVGANDGPPPGFADLTNPAAVYALDCRGTYEGKKPF
jgi:RHS repeat-associated protein